ncbi:DNA polymerase epsilon catalytic subunit A [Frankliniella fusca]|uniref:DNA polymerase epsilon catalytic subunit A n=1 Tax=Frankliniella fusca TaxID=407009 RepID=A0AAE1LV73_9NEOP|nr:DNA polymerase epsilon catalytic subunit A [Frankliniella fusca]
MSKMIPNKPYCITKIEPTFNDKFGAGELAYIHTDKKQKWRVQLPKKYLRTLLPGQLDTMKDAIGKQEYPYLVYRGTLEDNSYRLDIIKKCEEIIKAHALWEDVPELDDSLDEPKENN